MSKWISVDKELPEESLIVMVTYKIRPLNIRSICLASLGTDYRTKTKWWYVCGGKRMEPDDVVAWMPLCEPYMEDIHKLSESVREPDECIVFNKKTPIEPIASLYKVVKNNANVLRKLCEKVERME